MLTSSNILHEVIFVDLSHVRHTRILLFKTAFVYIKIFFSKVKHKLI